MQLRDKKKWVIFIMCMLLLTGINAGTSYGKEPIMEYKYTVEEQKIKRAQFIWKSCIDELKNENVLTTIDIKNINSYLSKEMREDKFEARLKRYNRQKNALRPTTIEKMVSEKIITPEQGGKLRDKMSKYNLSNLDK